MADAGKNAAKTLLEQIEVSFSAAQKPMSSLVHPQKPGLKAVEITPVLPGFGMWGDNFAIMSFDNDPDDDVPKVEGGGKRDVGQAVLMASQMEEKEDDELSYRRSSKNGAAAAAAAAAGAGAGAGGEGGEGKKEYTWIREYKFDMNHLDGEQFVFTWDEAQKVSRFFNVANHIELKRVKRKRKKESSEGNDPGTASVVIDSRDETEFEAHEANAKRRTWGACAEAKERERERHRKWRKRKRRDQEAAVACGCCCLRANHTHGPGRKLYRVLSCGCSGVECYTIMYHSMVGVTDYVWLNDVRSNLCCTYCFVYLILLFDWGPFERNGGSIWRGGEYWRCHRRRVTKHISLSLSPVRSSMACVGCSIKNWRTGEGQEAVITKEMRRYFKYTSEHTFWRRNKSHLVHILMCMTVLPR